jgi:hypothetical protein
VREHADGIAHVVNAIETADEIEILFRQSVSCSDLESNAIGQARLSSSLASRFNGR